MATGLKNVGNAFGGPSPAKTFQSAPAVIVDDDDDVVFIEPVRVPQSAPPPASRSTGFPPSLNENHRAELKSHSSHSSSKDVDSGKGIISETIIIDDEEEPEPSRAPDKNASSFSTPRLMDSNRPIADFPSSSTFPRNKQSTGMINSGITTEPDSEIQIANVTTLDSGLGSVGDGPLQSSEGRDMNLMITHVTSLQNPGMGEVPNGLQGASFGAHIQTYPSPHTSQNKPTTGPYNPGRINVSGDVFQNGESTTHHTSDAWLSQSASFPRNQQPGVEIVSPVASLPKQVLQQPPPTQQPSKAVKVTCANCKKPLQKGQTAYQRKGSTHLFCSTSCLSSFSQKPAPKKLCTMCKKDITTMKGTIVAQVDSSESFQEFCSTYCLSVYEDKQNSAKNQNKSRCTICGKLTEIRHEVSFKNMTHKLCSDHCFNRYRMANGLIMNCCEHCGEYLPSKGAGSNVLMIDGQWKRFCSPACLNDFKLKHGKLTSCTGCKAQCRIFDMTQCIGINGHMEPYCSTTCMNNHKARFAKPPPPPPPPPPPAPPVQTLLPIPTPGIICHFCKRNSLPQYQATMPDGKLYNFCSSECVAKFQTLSIQSSTNGQHVSSDLQLKCNYCKNMFSTKPATLDWEKKMYQFCSTICCDDFKKLHCIVTYCEYCQEEKTLHDTMKFSGVKRPFCSEGCKLLYKQDFAKRLGLKCVTCNYCFQMCKRGATKEFDGKLRDFCSEECSRKFHDWYYKAARCDCCRTQGTLKEKVQWRGIIKNFCDQQCLLRFYLQQNEPNMTTQKGPENMYLDQGLQTSRPRPMGINCTPVPPKDMKNKAVLCKPLSMTKATYCKPHMQTKTSQTEEDPNTKYVPVPIPVPVYVPVPMNLYSQNVPAPTAIPVPVPIPIFVPADWDKIKELNEEFKLKDLKLDMDLKVKDFLKVELEKEEEMEDSLSLKDEDMEEEEKVKVEDQDSREVWDILVNDEDELREDDESLQEEVKEEDDLKEDLTDDLKENLDDCLKEDLDDGLKEDLDGGLKEDLDGGLKEDLDGGLKEDLDGGLKEDLDGGLKEDLDDGLKEDLDDGLKEDLDDGLKEDLDDGLKEDLDDGLKEDLGGGLKEDLGGGLKEALGGGLKEDLGGGLKEDLGGGLKEDLGGGLKEDLGGGLKEDLGGDLKEDLGGDLKEDLGGGLKEDLGGGLKEDLGGGLKEDLGGGLKEALGGGLKEALGGSLKEALGDGLKEALGDGLKEALGDGLKEALGDGLKEALGEDLSDYLNDDLDEDVKEENYLKREEEVTEDDLSDGSPFHPLEIVEIEDPITEEQTLCDVTDEIQVDESKSCSADSTSSLPDVPYEPELDIEDDFPRAEELDTESEFLLPPVFGEEYDVQPRPKPLKKGLKRKAVLSDSSLPESSVCAFPLKCSYGVNAWKHWVKTTPQEELVEMRLKENLLEHTASELSHGLSRFVKEVRRSNGDSYSPDSIYYLCLGIQEFMSRSRRTDNLFSDPEYQEFGEEFNIILRSWQPSILPDGSMFSRVEEDYLWQTNQLGTHSAVTLLFTLCYFNTKYFNLRTIDQHLRLSFGTILKQWKGNPLTQERKACLQYQVSSLCEDKVSSGKRKHEDDEPVFEQIENTADPSRCPVKIFEYYLSKSPSNLDQRMDLFYLNPESSSTSESLLWFTSSSLDQNTLENMLIRVLLVKDIYDKSSYELDDDTD
ncbi:zinc finger MYM-type protein 2 isoform X2 [Lithobates pipiens]